MSGKRVVIIGAGIGGLAAALDLAVQGFDVTVVERAAAPGGKMREVFVGGQAIDAGPTVFTMRWVFEALFAHAGANLADHLVLHPATTLARHAWPDGSRLDLFADVERSAEAIEQFAGAADAAGYRAFCKDAARIYKTLEEPFIKARRPSMTDLVSAAGIVPSLRLKPFQTLWDAVGARMTDPRLRQLFGRYSTYAGTAPFVAPATLMLIAHVEQDGVWLVEGGMHQVALALADLAAAHGATFRYDSHVADIVVVAGRAAGVRLVGGEVLHADAVIHNGEPSALATGQLGARAKVAAAPLKFPQRSLSAATWAGLAQTGGFPLLRHTLFFSTDYKLEFDLIRAGRLPTEPTVYICAQDRTDQNRTDQDGEWPDGQAERLLVLVNAPPNGDHRGFSQVEIDQCMQGITSLLQRCGLEMRFTEAPVMTVPATFHRLFPGSAGALYGPAVIGSGASFKRPDNRTKLPGLYLAGGSTHPGAGVPMAALSGRRAAAEVSAELTPRPRGLTRLFRRTATPGGISTR